MQKLAAGIDIGGTNTVFGLVDEKGIIHSRGRMSTVGFSDPLEFSKALASEIMNILPQGSSLAGAGIGAPSGNYFSGSIQHPPNMPWKGIIPLAAYLNYDLKCKTWLTNDANAAALGELYFGGGKGKKDFIFITLGTGLGSGLIVNGEMVYGHDGMAGELGHVTVVSGGRLCGCGKHGCLETYCSATGIVNTYCELSGKNKNEVPDALFVFERAKANEPAALEAFQRTGQLLGETLANSVAYTSPEIIFLFGGLAQSGEMILKPTVEHFEKNLYPIYRGKVKIMPSRLPGNDAAILGAASLAWNELNK